MSRTVIAPGQRYGMLTVVSRIQDYVSPAGHRKSAWAVRCDCGVETTTLGNRMSAGEALSCGCLYRARGLERRRDITGSRFGALVAVEQLPTSVSSTGNRATRWRFRCDCGAIVDAQPSNVIRTARICRHGRVER